MKVTKSAKASICEDGLGLLSWWQDQEGEEMEAMIVRRCVTNILVTLFKIFTNIISKYILLLFRVMLTHI